MRKWFLIPCFGLILACGGGTNLGSSDFSYPNTRNLTVTFRNTSAVPTKMWTEPDETEPATTLAGGASRSKAIARTWDAETSTFVFSFKAREGAGAVATTSISINGQESHADNFSGFLVEWRVNPANGVHYLHSETQ